ncbi:MAG: hypothetical protein RL345_778 [Chloroflexota bacterium]
MTVTKVGCHTIVFKEDERKDLDLMLRTVAEAGYPGVESGMLCDGDGNAAKAKLHAHGLVQGSLSTNWRALDTFDDVLRYADTVGANLIQMSGQNRPEEGLAWYDAFAPRFNDAARRAHDAGKKLCYHNHSWEFLRYDEATGHIVPGDPNEDAASTGQAHSGVVAMDRLLDRTDPAHAYLCVDIHWVHHGGLDPVKFVTDHASRIGYVHIKDMAYVGPQPRRSGVLRFDDSVFAELGRGEVDLVGTWNALKPLNLPWAAYEQDRSSLPTAEAIGISRAFLRDHLGV